MITTVTIGAFLLIALAILGAVKTLMDKIHTDLMPSILTAVQDINALKQTSALTKQQSDTNTARLNGQSDKIADLQKNALPPAAVAALLSAPTPTAPPPAPASEAPLPPAVSGALQAMADHAAAIASGVADINRSQTLTRTAADGPAGVTTVLTPLQGGGAVAFQGQQANNAQTNNAGGTP